MVIYISSECPLLSEIIQTSFTLIYNKDSTLEDVIDDRGQRLSIHMLNTYANKL